MNTNKIFSLIPKVMQEIGAVGKDGRNTAQNYEYRKIEDMYNEIQPALIKYGVFCVPSVVDKSMEKFTSSKGTITFHCFLTVSHRFYAEDGSFVDVVTVGEGIDTSDKASNKAMSGAMKYAFIELFSLPTVSAEDSDRTSPEVDANGEDKKGQAKPQGFAGKTPPPAQKQVQQQQPQAQAAGRGFGSVKTKQPDPLRPPEKEVPHFPQYDNDFDFNQDY